MSVMSEYRKDVFLNETYKNEDGSVTQSLAALGYDELSNVLSVEGDRKAANPHSYVKTYLRNTSGVDDWKYWLDGDLKNVVAHKVLSTVIPPSPLSYTAEEAKTLAANLALAKFTSQVKGSNNLAVDIAESTQAIAMLKNAASLKGWIGGIDKKVSGWQGNKSPKVIADWFANKWLEYTYGWKPLVYSTYDALDTIFKKSLNDGITKTVTSRAWKEQATKSSGSGTYGDPTLTVNHVRSTRCRIQVVYSASLGTELSDWTSLNPVLIAWELVPYSFVLDWFTSIGDYLKLAEDVFFVNQQVQSTVTTFTSSDLLLWSYKGNSPGTPWYWPNGSPGNFTVNRSLMASGSLRINSLSRSVGSVLPVPKLPPMKLQLGASQMLSATALGYQMLGKFLSK